MKNTILLSFIIAIQSLSAQRTLYSRAGIYQWEIQTDIMGLHQNSRLVNLSNDSILLNGKYFRKFDNYYVREENKKYYLYNTDSTQSDQLMFDFNLNVNDTFHYINYNTKIDLKVIQRDLVIVENDTLVKLYLKNTSNIPYLPVIAWVESIGSLTFHPLVWDKLFNTTDINIYMSCFLDSNNNSLLDKMGISCYPNDFNNSKEWTYIESQSNGDFYYAASYFSSDKDTVIDSKTYHVVYNNIFPSQYYRKDTTTGKFYLRKYYGEIMFFDENAKIGDTISNAYLFSPHIVDSIRYAIFGGKYRKIYYTKNETFVSGIGTLNQIFWQIGDVFTPEYRFANICYFENTQDLYHYNSYSIYNDCRPFSAIADIQKESLQFYWYNSKLYVSSQLFFANKPTLIIYDILGREIRHLLLTNEMSQSLDLTLLRIGFYIARLQVGNKFYTLRFEQK